MEIAYDTVGTVKKGEMKGWQVKVSKDLEEGTGGYYILLSEDFSDKKNEAYDDWVESEKSLKKYFKEYDWSIDWGEK